MDKKGKLIWPVDIAIPRDATELVVQFLECPKLVLELSSSENNVRTISALVITSSGYI